MERAIDVPFDLGPGRAADWLRSWSEVVEADELSVNLPPSALGACARVWIAAGKAARRARGCATVLTGSEAARRSIEDIARVRDLRSARELAESEGERLERELEGAAPSPLRMARFVFEELGANVVQHSGAPETGFGAIQSFPEERGFELAFADAGVGFLASLQRNPELAGRLQSEGEAVQIALGKGVTGTGEGRKNMGIGLGLLQDFADRLDGELWIGSGDAFLRRRTTAGVRSNTLHAVAAWPGAWICLRARIG